MPLRRACRLSHDVMTPFVTLRLGKADRSTVHNAGLQQVNQRRVEPGVVITTPALGPGLDRQVAHDDLGQLDLVRRQSAALAGIDVAPRIALGRENAGRGFSESGG